MNGFIRNFTVVKVICHILLIAIWIYWGTCIHPLTTGWFEWTILIGGGVIYFFVGGICIILDDESNIRNGDEPFWAFGYSLTNLLLFGSMVCYMGLYPNELYLLVWPSIFVVITLLLCGFNGGILASLLAFISISLWASNWGINRWYDYCILIGSLIVAFYSIMLTFLKCDEEVKYSVKFWIVNFGFCSLVNLGLLSLLYFNELLDTNNPCNVLYLTVVTILFSLVISTRLITLLLVAIAGIIYLWRNTEFTLSFLIPDLSFEWIYHDRFKRCVGISSGLLLMILIIRYYNRKIGTQRDIIERLEQTSILPMVSDGLIMTCPYCRKTMVEGKYAESTARGVAKTTAKVLLKTSSVGTFISIGLTIGGPIGAVGGFAIGSVITFLTNKKIDKGVETVMDLWNYEVDGGRTVYFKCPRHECGYEWTKTETYGEIEL